MKKFIAMIPARMASTRYPDKPLIDICGMTMIEHVWQRVKMRMAPENIYIATCDEAIRQAAMRFGAKIIMTSDQHERCTDRIAEACEKLLNENTNFDVVFNIQGDEPLFDPSTIDLLEKPFVDDNELQCVNLIERLDGEDINNVNHVKAIFDQRGFALYFSRLPIPHDTACQHYKQLGVYGLAKSAVLKYARMPQTPLEIAESVDMLRFVENRIPVKVVLSEAITFGVDTPEDHKKVNKLIINDVYFKSYKNTKNEK